MTGALETYAGGDPLVVTLAGYAVPGDRRGPVSILRGRRSADVRPEAAVASLTIYTDTLPALPELGDDLVVDLAPGLLDALAADLGTALPAGVARRFTGTVTDAAIRPDAGVVTVVGAGPRSRAARIPIGDVPWPAELDGARAARILAALLAADPSFVVIPGDPGTVTVLARDVDRQPAAALLDELAAYTGGDTWETRAGELCYRDARSRTDATPALTLAAANVMVDPQFEKNLDGLVTRLTVRYGDPVAELVIEDTTAPITTLGASVTTPLAAEADAQAYGIEVVGRRSRPRWAVPDLPIDVLRTLDPDQRVALLDAEPGTLIALTGMPSAAPFAASQLWVEGWTEAYTRDAWRMRLAVSPRGLTGRSARWIDVPATYQPAGGVGAPLPMTWSAAPFAGLSWLATAGWWTSEDITEGRWADVPASLLWSNYPSSTEWGDLP